MQFPTGRYTLPDGSIFLEGTGVAPTLRVPIDEETVFSEEDVVLQTAERAVLLPLGAGMEPSAPPKLVSGTDAEEVLLAGTDFLEDVAREDYTAEELETPDSTFTYTVALSSPKSLIWAYGWCASTEEVLDENFEHIQLKFILEGSEVSEEKLATYEYSPSGMECRLIYAALTDWKAGEHHMETYVTFDQAINDGTADNPASTRVYQYNVYVKP